MEDQNTNPSSEALAGADGNVPASDGQETVGADATLAELNKILGGNFKDLPSALKAVSDTKAFVGKRVEDIKAELAKETQASPDASKELEAIVKPIKDRLFYSENPQYKGYEDLIASMGTDPAEVVASEPFKKVFEKVQVADKVEQEKSVIHSSPRLAQQKTITEEAVKVANAAGSTIQDIANTFAAGLLEG